MDDLFRDEAVRAQRPQLLGTVRLASPVSHRIWGMAAAAITIALLLWLFFGHYTRRESVNGSLVPPAGLLKVTARVSGTVTKLNVHVGSQVRAGEILLELSDDRISAALGDTGKDVSTQLLHEQADLRSDLVSSKRLTDEQAHDLHMQSEMLRNEVGQLGLQLATTQRQEGYVSRLLYRLLPLQSEGYVSLLQIQGERNDELEIKAQVEGLERQRTALVQQLNDVSDQLLELPLTAATKADGLQRQIDQVQQALAQNDAQSADVLRAPKSGTVTAVLTRPGQTIAAGQALVSVLPKGSRLQAQLLVPSNAIGFVRIGTPVVLHYQAFPYQKFGVQRGTVSTVSRSALTPEEVAVLLGQPAPPKPMYLVEVGLAKQSIEAYGKQQALIPGMALHADLLLDRRRVIQWIFEPLYGMAKRGGGNV